MIRRVFALTESGAKEISNKEPNVPIQGTTDPTLDQVLAAGNEATDQSFRLNSSDPSESFLEATPEYLALIRGDSGHVFSEITPEGFYVLAGTDLNPTERSMRMAGNGLEAAFGDAENQGSTRVDFEPPGLAEYEARTMTVRYADGFFASEEYVNQENSVVLSITRVRRYAKSSGFTSSNSTTPVVVDSIPLGDPADLENKRLHLLSIIEKVGNNGALTVTAYLHNAAITIGGAPAGTQIATYTSAANQNDFPVERARMFVSGGQLFPARPASSMLNDMVNQGAVLSGITIPSNAHIIIAASVQNASDSFQPRYITLEY